MRKIFTFIIAFMALALPITVLASDDKSTSKPIILSSHQEDDIPQNPIHRAPMRIPVEAMQHLYLGGVSS